MISEVFYNKANLTSALLGGRVKHFPIKDRSVIVSWRDYVMKENDSIYTLAENLFGKNLGHLWTYIADANPLRHPDSWNTGDIIKLPRIIIRDSDTDSTLRRR